MKKYVVLAGNIGAGKSTLVGRLADRLDFRPYYEPVTENPILKISMATWSAGHSSPRSFPDPQSQVPPYADGRPGDRLDFVEESRDLEAIIKTIENRLQDKQGNLFPVGM
jgi:deoxyadenosine/deoxycytidine kinase